MRFVGLDRLGITCGGCGGHFGRMWEWEWEVGVGREGKRGVVIKHGAVCADPHANTVGGLLLTAAREAIPR